MTFEQAFYEINGRKPTSEEVKHALAMRRIVNESDLDPVLLLYLADTQAQAARKRGLDEMRRATGEAVERFQAILPNIAEAERNIGALKAVQTTLQNLTASGRDILALAGMIAVGVGLLWTLSLVATWKTAYAWGRNDAGAATHATVCADLSERIASMSTYWRKLGYPQAAEKLGRSYDTSCR